MQAQELLQELEGRENGSAGMEYGGRSSSRTAGPASLSMKYWVNFKCLELLGTGLILQCIGICSQKPKETKAKDFKFEQKKFKKKFFLLCNYSCEKLDFNSIYFLLLLPLNEFKKNQQMFY